MRAPELAAETIPWLPGRTAMVWLTIVVLSGAFYVIEHANTRVSTLEAFTITGDEMAEGAAKGDTGRRLAIPVLGLFGALLLLRRDGWRLELRSPLGWLLLGYLAWCGMSLLWSDDLPLTFRRFSALLFCSVGALGIARQVTMRDLCLITLVVATILVSNSVLTEIALGTFHPLSPDYRFAGTLHPNVQAPYCAAMALAAFCLASRAKRGRALLWMLFLIGTALLVLTKSRTTCAGLLAGLLAYASLNVSWRQRIMIGAALFSLGSAVALAAALMGSDVVQRATDVALLGRQDEAESLSGRIPLWAKLLPHVQERFSLGHGYETFWSPQRIESFSRSFEWTVPDGHCVFGCHARSWGGRWALSLAVILLSLPEVARRYRASDDVGYGYLFVLLVYRSLSGLLESALAVPTSMVPFMMVCGLAHVSFCRPPGDCSSPEDARHGLPADADDPGLSEFQ